MVSAWSTGLYFHEVAQLCFYFFALKIRDIAWHYEFVFILPISEIVLISLFPPRICWYIIHPCFSI